MEPKGRDWLWSSFRHYAYGKPGPVLVNEAQKAELHIRKSPDPLGVAAHPRNCHGWGVLCRVRVPLGQPPDRQPFGDCDRALVGSFLADHHPEERCLARPIGTDQSDFFAGIQLKRSIHEEQLLADCLLIFEKEIMLKEQLAAPLPLPV
jgi:hypothetical protein